MKVGQKVQAKLNNRWRDVKITRINKKTITVETPGGPIALNPELVRVKPRKKTTSKTPTKKPTTTNTKTITKSVKTKEKPAQTTDNTPKPGTKKNPWIPLNDLRSHNAISSLDYETKVKFDTIIKSLIEDL